MCEVILFSEHFSVYDVNTTYMNKVQKSHVYTYLSMCI